MTYPTRKSAAGLLILGALILGSPSVRADPVEVTTGKIKAIAGNKVVVPILVKGVKAVKGLGAMSIRLTYDPQVLTYKSLEKGPILPNAIFDASIDEKADPGKIGLGFACGRKSKDSEELTSVEKDGAVLKIIFLVNAKAKIGKKSPLKLDNVRALDSEGKELPIKLIDGSIEIVEDQKQIPKGSCFADTRLGIADTRCALQMSVGNRPVSLNMDRDNDGQVTSRDAAIIIQMVADQTRTGQ
jgi:hypothetical protein